MYGVQNTAGRWKIIVIITKKESKIMNLPESFVTTGLKLSEGATIMGIKFSNMTRDELIAVAAHGWTEEANSRKEGMRQMDFMMMLNRASRRI